MLIPTHARRGCQSDGKYDFIERLFGIGNGTRVPSLFSLLR